LLSGCNNSGFSKKYLMWGPLFSTARPNYIQGLYFTDLGKKLTVSGCERLFLTNGSALPEKFCIPSRCARPTADFFVACDTSGAGNKATRGGGGTFCPAFYFYSNMRQDTLAR
jgi:hypothetical protein